MSTASANNETDPKGVEIDPSEEPAQTIEVKEPDSSEPSKPDFPEDPDDGKEFDWDVPASIDADPAPSKPAPTPPVTTPSPTQPTAPTATPPVSPQTPPAVSPAPAPATTPVANPTPTAPVPGPSSPEPVSTPPETGLDEAREKFVTDLSGQFQLSADDADKLITNPNEVLPKMAARVVATAYEAIMRTLGAQLPMMLETYQAGTRLKNEVETEFFSAWPALKEHGSVVENIGRAYRAGNPSATKDEAIRAIGAMAMVSLGLPLSPTAPQPPAPQAPPTSLPPHAPVVGGPGPVSNQPRHVNLFEYMAALPDD